MAAYLQTAGCWAVSGDIRQPQPPGGGGGVGQPAGRPLSHCALPSRSATVYHSEGGGTSRTGPPDHFPHQRRTSTLRELVGEMHKHTHPCAHTHAHNSHIKMNMIFYVSCLLCPPFLMQCDTMLLGELDDLNRFMRSSADSSSIFHNSSDAAVICNGSE